MTPSAALLISMTGATALSVAIMYGRWRFDRFIARRNRIAARVRELIPHQLEPAQTPPDFATAQRTRFGVRNVLKQPHDGQSSSDRRAA